ncbi:hypothetical protein [Nonomuraea sp. NPDC049480]|uniref:hypothetical protein n=1 Tax=Nonomuraea sp. NPDC049480 TaxID=3364353 RepID=UPI0037AB2538
MASPQWSPGGRTVQFAAYRTPRDESITTFAFITLNVTDRIPRLVKAGPRHRLSNWDIGRKSRFALGTLLRHLRSQGRGRRQAGVVDAAAGAVVHRIGGDVHAIPGWYDDRHVILAVIGRAARSTGRSPWTAPSYET